MSSSFGGHYISYLWQNYENHPFMLHRHVYKHSMYMNFSDDSFPTHAPIRSITTVLLAWEEMYNRKSDKDRGCALPSIFSRIRRTYREHTLGMRFAAFFFHPVAYASQRIMTRFALPALWNVLSDMYTALHRGMRTKFNNRMPHL
jgi:hypothetical protein